MNVRAWPVGLLGVGAIAGVAVAGYVFIFWGSRLGDCSDGTSRFAYSVYGKGIRSTDVAVFSEGEETRVTVDGQSGDPSFSPDGNRVVYSTGRLGTWDPEYGSGENGFERRALFTTRVTEASRTQGLSSGDQLTRGPFDTEPPTTPPTPLRLKAAFAMLSTWGGDSGPCADTGGSS